MVAFVFSSERVEFVVSVGEHSYDNDYYDDELAAFTNYCSLGLDCLFW